jgi:hypothetical protein
MPAPKKLLPRPCPQCGLENGGMQWVIFNPRYSNSYEYNTRPYSILRISHYSKELYDLSSKKKKKIVHNFRIFLFYRIRVETEFGETKHIHLDEIFNDPNFYLRKSITLPVTKSWFEFFKNNDWYSLLKTERAHFVNKERSKKSIVNKI